MKKVVQRVPTTMLLTEIGMMVSQTLIERDTRVRMKKQGVQVADCSPGKRAGCERNNYKGILLDNAFFAT